ncbi:deoxyhypusine synthase [candidate division KSB1 bacterium]
MTDPLKKYKRLQPKRVSSDVHNLIDTAFLAFNSARLREACEVFTCKYAPPEVTIGVSLAGALTPAGLGVSCLNPLMEAGLVDWIVSTGANLYHDLHFALGQELYIGNPKVDDRDLKKKGIVRIYDIFFNYDVLFEADAYVRDFCREIGHKKQIGSAEFHNMLGQKLLSEFKANREKSVLMTAAELDIPIFTSSPGDSTLGMNLAAVGLEETPIDFNVTLDINQTSAIIHHTKKHNGLSGLIFLGGGSPKNFILQTEPYIQEILMLKEKGHDYYIQFTDARPDTGGLSGATPSEAVSWGKINPDTLSDSIVCYGDTTLLLPLFTAYILESGIKRPHKRYYKVLDTLTDELRTDYRNSLPSGKE